MPAAATTDEKKIDNFYDGLAKSFGETPETLQELAKSGAAPEQQEFVGGAGGAVSGNRPGLKAKGWGEVLFDAYGSTRKGYEMKKLIGSIALQKISTDQITSLLVTSLADRMPWIRQSEAQLLNMMDMAADGAVPDIVDDYMFRITERRQGTIRASRINPETNLPAYQDGLYSEKYNVLGFWGDPVTATFVGSAQAKKQRGIDVLKQQIESELLKIKKAENFDCWNGVMNTMYTGGQVTQIGGLLSRIFTNTDSAGGGSPTEYLMNEANTDLNQAINAGGNRVAFFNDNGVAAIWGIELNRYGGSNQVSYAQWATANSERFNKFGLVPDKIYQPPVGKAIAVFHDYDLPTAPAAGVMMAIDPDYVPSFAKFQIGEESGPFMFVRPTFNLQESVMILDGGTLNDPAQESRFLFTNLHS